MKLSSKLQAQNSKNFTMLLLNIDSDLIQNSGGELEMEYDQENTYFKAHCLEHHIGDVFGAMVSAALKPIPTATANVFLLIYRLLHYFKGSFG